MQLSGWLKAETSKPRKQRHSFKQIHADLQELGYEGSYGRVAAFARQWKADQTDWVNSLSKPTGVGHSWTGILRRRGVKSGLRIVFFFSDFYLILFI